MAQVTDQTTDFSGAQTHKLVTLYNAPSFVKTAGTVDYDNLSSEAFAGEQQTFPVHTPRDVWLSAAFFTQQVGGFPKQAAHRVALNILESARVHGIQQEVIDLFEKAASLEEIMAQDDGIYGLEFNQDGRVIKSFPLNNVEEIKLASIQFEARRKDMTSCTRVKLAKEIVKRASECRASDVVTESVYKTAGAGYVTPRLIADAWWARAHQAKRLQKTAAYNLAAASARTFSKAVINSVASEDAEKVANQLSQFDREVGLTHLYGETLAFPEEAIFSVSHAELHKMASQTMRLVTGNVYELCDLQNLSLEKVAEVLGDDLAAELRCPMTGDMDIEKAAAVLATLPRREAVTLERLLAEARVEPALTMKRAFSVLRAG